MLRTVALAVSILVPCGHLEADQVPSAARQAELEHLLIQDCGSCHGLTLKGGLGPPLVPSALAGKPPESLVATVLYGRPGTAMPPWQAFLTESEVRWLVSRLLEGRPQ